MTPNENIDNLYCRPVESKRTGPLYNAFSYPTKIDPEAVAVFLAAHTQPGETVLDPFAGSGSTGIAACLCDRPTPRMISLAKKAGVKPTWGPRNAILYELSSVGSLLARVMTNPPSPKEFSNAATHLLDDAIEQFGWSYEALSPNGEPGHIRYIIWSEVLKTPCCGHQLTLWDAAVDLNPAKMDKNFDCPKCGVRVETATCERVVSKSTDFITGEVVRQRRWQPARVYGRSTSGTWSRPPTAADLKHIDTISRSPIPGDIPTDQIDWGDLHRSGYHTGISRFHHLYTGRNLRALATLWKGIGHYPPQLSDALKLLVLSYNASHSTLMARVVVKKQQKDLVVTGTQSGVMYISGLPVEKNVFSGIRRKIKTFARSFALTHGSHSAVEVVNGSSTTTHLMNDSVDYVFTDPPFGDFIPYAEVNQVNESWMGQLTDRTEEAIISPSQNKGVEDYAQLLVKVFSEMARVLKPAGAATIIFHASKPPVWHALGEAFRRNRFIVEKTSVLDKTQMSFKQVVHEGGTRGDAVFLLRLDKNATTRPNKGAEALDRTIHNLEIAANENPAELNPHRMYSRYVAHCVEMSLPVAVTAPEFYAHISNKSFETSADGR